MFAKHREEKENRLTNKKMKVSNKKKKKTHSNTLLIN